MWSRIPGAALTVALATASLAAFSSVAAGQQDSAAQADVPAWAGVWRYRAVIESPPSSQVTLGPPRLEMSGRLTFELKDGTLIGEMDEESAARRWRIEGVRVERTRLTGIATLSMGSIPPGGAPGSPEDYRLLEIQLRLAGDRFTGSVRARSLRGSMDGTRP